MRILILGLDNAGKTTVLKRFNGEDTSGISPTVGFNIKSLSHKGFLLNFWDVGGQKCLRAYWRNYFETTDGIIWVVDANDVARLNDCATELHNLLGEDRLAGATVLIFANKQDIPTALSKDEIWKLLKCDELEQQKRHVLLLGCSAMTGEGLHEGVDWLVEDIAARIFLD